MAKLGYTWYPKDWTNSESVFELDLQQRGLYRELIDLAMLNDNKTILKESVWARKFNISKKDLNSILDALIELNLIEITDENLFIPSCESRLKMVRGGSKGGKTSKPIVKPISKPTAKPSSNQKKDKLKEKEKKEVMFDIFWAKYPRKVSKANCLKKWLKLDSEEIEVILNTIDSYINYKPFEGYTHPNPETYFNQKRWADAIPVVKKPVGNMYESNPYKQ